MAPRLRILMLTLLSAAATSAVPLGFPQGQPVAKEWPCPSTGDIAPCTCEPDASLNLNMDCSLVTDDDELRRVFEAAFPFPSLQNFTIAHSPADGNDLRNLDAGIFGDVSFQHVAITGTKIQVVSENVFAESHASLRSLDLSSNLISTFPFETLASFLALQTFLIDDNFISALPKVESASLEVLSISDNQDLALESDALVGAPMLTSVSMGNISLKELLPGLLTRLPDLQEVVLDDNQLSELAEGALHTINNKLQKVSLAGNTISQVVHDSIHGFAAEASLSLASNAIEKLEESVWRPIFNELLPLGTIDLEGNPLECGCDLKWVFQSSEDYLSLISRLSSCSSGSLVHDLNPDYFDKFC